MLKKNKKGDGESNGSEGKWVRLGVFLSETGQVIKSRRLLLKL